MSCQLGLKLDMPLWLHLTFSCQVDDSHFIHYRDLIITHCCVHVTSYGNHYPKIVSVLWLHFLQCKIVVVAFCLLLNILTFSVMWFHRLHTAITKLTLTHRHTSHSPSEETRMHTTHEHRIDFHRRLCVSVPQFIWRWLWHFAKSAPDCIYYCVFPPRGAPEAKCERVN